MIKIVLGPMFASKTSTIIAEIERLIIAEKSCVAIKHAIDNRYSANKQIITHNHIIFDKIDILCAEYLQRVDDIVYDYDVIWINEGQFYEDVVEYASRWANAGKIVLIDALNGDFRQKPFENISRLISVADQVTHKTAICLQCKRREAPFTIRTVSSDSQFLVGSSDIYKVVCRECLITVKSKIENP
jgi:thymidine kinase